MVQQEERLRLAQEKVERLRKELKVPVFGTALNPVKLNELNLQQSATQLTQARVEAVGSEGTADRAWETFTTTAPQRHYDS